MAQPALPSNQPQWADGGTIVEPSTPYKSTGWTAIKPPFAYFNWWMNKVYQWTQYLNAKANFLPGTLADEVLVVTANTVVPTQANSTTSAVTANLGYATFTNFTTGGLWLVRGNGTNAVTVKHQLTAVPAAFQLAGNSDVVLNDKKDYLLFQLNADGYWYEISRSASLPHGGMLIGGAGANTISNGDENILVNTGAGAATMTLPSAAQNKGRIFRIKKTSSDANTVTVSTTSSQTIDGNLTQVLSAQYATLVVISDGSNWSLLAPPQAPSQLVVDGGASASSATVYTATPAPAFAAYFTGMSVQWQAVLANTGAATLNVNGLGAKNLKVFVNGAKADPQANIIAAGARIIATYDGTDFLIVGGTPATGQRLIAKLSPSAAASVAITGLTAGTKYRVQYNLLQNTSTGTLNGRINNDSGSNYYYQRLNFNNTAPGTSGTGGSNATTFPISAEIGVVAGQVCIGSFDVQAWPGTLTKASIKGDCSTSNAAGSSALTGMFGANYNGGANITEIDIIASAGTFTGEILVFAIGG